MEKMNEKMLILADDLTGALDSGVQLTRRGAKVEIRSDGRYQFDDNTDVLVIDTETRHIPKEDAYRIIYDLVKEAVTDGVTRIYKKTDSGLRGNVGAELTAVLDASEGSRLAFVPAWPKMGRTTKNGIHFVNGVPLSESIFASDVIDPVCESEVAALIRLQSDAEVNCYSKQDSGRGIVVYDCETDEEMAEVSRQLFTGNETVELAAGCAGLLEQYPVFEDRKTAGEVPAGALGNRLLVLSGSMNDVTKKQLEYAEEKGAYRVHVPMDRILSGKWSEEEIGIFTEEFMGNAVSPVAIIDTMTPVDTKICDGNPAKQIADSMGKTAKSLLEHNTDRTIMIIGGDTLKGFIQMLGIEALRPVRELTSGTVLASYIYKGDTHYLITKSGGFGETDQLIQIQKQLEEEK